MYIPLMFSSLVKRERGTPGVSSPTIRSLLTAVQLFTPSAQYPIWKLQTLNSSHALFYPKRTARPRENQTSDDSPKASITFCLGRTNDLHFWCCLWRLEWIISSFPSFSKALAWQRLLIYQRPIRHHCINATCLSETDSCVHLFNNN